MVRRRLPSWNSVTIILFAIQRWDPNVTASPFPPKVGQIFSFRTLLSSSITLCWISRLSYILWYWYYMYDFDIQPHFRAKITITAHSLIHVRAAKSQTYSNSWEESERFDWAIRTLVKSTQVSEWSCLHILNTLILSYIISYLIHNITWSVSQPANRSTKLRWHRIIVFATDMT